MNAVLDVAGTVLLIAAAMSTGLMAGVFGLYAHTIMPGLRRTDDRTFVGAFRAIDRAIINPWFLVVYLGGPVCAGLAAVLQVGGGGLAAWLWIVVAIVLYAPALVITSRVHLPLNNGIKAAGEPDRIADLAAVRARFNEARWTRWNVVRAVCSTAAFACLVWALVEHGRRL